MASSSGSSSMIKSRFVTEAEVEEAKKKRQEEWEEARNSGRKLPTEEVEAPVDYRSLYEKLQEQKVKKQEEHDEQFKFKNMIYKGLDQDESDFLAFAASKQAEINLRRFDKESEELKDYRDSVTHMLSRQTDVSVASERQPEKKQPPADHSKSQKSLLAGLVRRKRTANEENKSQENKDGGGKRTCTGAVDGTSTGIASGAATKTAAESATPSATTTTQLRGLAMYSDSSDSDGSHDS